MQAISPITASTAVRIRAARLAAESAATTAPSECRSVIPIRPIMFGAPAPATRRYPLAGFLAHLIAVKQLAPQTRRRARATPREASAAYAATQTMGQAAERYRKSA